MKDPNIALQTKYYQLLQGITYNGEAVPIYDMPPDEPTYPHIQFQSRSLSDISDKQSYRYDVRFGLRVIDRFHNNFASRKSIYEVTNEIKLRMRTRERFAVDGWNITTAVVGTENFFQEVTKTYTYYRNEIIFNHLIQQQPLIVDVVLQYNGEELQYDGETIIYGQEKTWQ